VRRDVPSRESIPQRRDERAFPRFAALIIGLILMSVTVGIGATAINWSTVSESHLVYSGATPEPPLFNVKVEDEKHFFHVTSRPKFKNIGFKSAAIKRVDIRPVGLKQPARELKLLYLDNGEIGWLETREVRYEFLAVINSASLNIQDPLEFRVYFYAPDDREVYREGITIEHVDRRSSRSRPWKVRAIFAPTHAGSFRFPA
jgi:hypothetical protein